MEPLPDLDAPGLRVESKVLVAFVVYQSQTDGDASISQRYLQMMLNRSDRRSAADLLKRLCSDGWLVVTRPHSRITATRYSPGPRISDDDKDKWVTIGERLFGVEGSLGGFRATPSIKHGYLGVSGLLVIGTLMGEGPVHKSVLVKALSPLISSSALRRRPRGVFDRLIRSEVLSESEDGLLSVPDGIRERIGRYEAESGAREKAQRLDEQLRSQQQKNNRLVLGSELLQAFRKFLKGLPCSVCRQVPEVSDSEVDHYPPVHLGGFDAIGRLFPICRSCNNSMSDFVKRMKSPEEPDGGQIQVICTDDPDDLQRFVQALADFRYLDLLLAFEDDDPERTARGVAATDPLWKAVHGFGSPVTVVDMGTGEIFVVQPADPDSWHIPPRSN
jgi:hypothetical protein